MSLRDQLDFIGAEEMRRICERDEKEYLKKIMDYLKSNMDARLQREYDREAWKQYSRLAGELCETSTEIGAMEIAQRADALRIAGEEDNIDFFHQKHKTLMDDYQMLAMHLEAALEEEGVWKKRSGPKSFEKIFLQMMRTLVGTIDAKDQYTNGHSERVAEYSRMMAREMGMTEEEQQDVYYTGLLHDIGKIGIPDDILKKSTELSVDEYDVVKNHPAIGAKILANITEMPGIDIGAHWHHERYDGKGYPDGLKGEEIPEMARLIAVADTYDAMTSKRCYRDVLPQEVVRKNLCEGRGTQFDPKYADIMLKLMEQDVDYSMREM